MKHTLYYIACVCALALVGCSKPQTTLTILHTNDTHSQVEPTDKKAKKDANMGGYARRMGLIAEERKADPNLLLLDCGDFSQGTPYFNYYHGRIEIDALNRMGYDAGTLGNHEFDNGLDTLAMVVKRANFPIVCANYNFAGTPLEGLVKPYTIIKKGGLRIGVFGIGVNPEGLIAKKNFEPIQYLEPLPVFNEMGRLLKEKEHCDLVVCISHQGSDAAGTNDLNMIPDSHNVDIVLGGHTHHVFNGERVQNADGQEVVVSQMGKAGLRMGKLIVTMAAEE